MFCPECGVQINDKAVICPKCGVPVAGTREDVKSYMVASILLLVFCLPSGIIPLIYSCKVNSKLAQGDINGAQAASKKAKLWVSIMMIIFGALILFVFIGNALPYM